ncbi:MAG TPA: class I SAM-dependent methyltransferase [Longimicrobiales bacterium]|nr:class I SAM-dependent methyltransferase [Longimicrobiales bacterium]
MLLLAIAIVASIAAIVFAALFIQYRRRLYFEQGRDTGGTIRTVELDEFDDVFRQTDLGPTLEAEVRFVGSGRGVPGGTSDREAWILATLAKGRRTMFEFGTATGKTTYLLARNSPDDARVHTITLPPDALAQYDAGVSDSGLAERKAREESVFTTFLYTGTDVEPKVEQLYGDSKALDATPWAGRCDLIFVDGSHAYSYVKSDTEKALRMIAPGGVILWHDYQPLRRSVRDVCRALDEVAGTVPLVRLSRTTLVAYRAPE